MGSAAGIIPHPASHSEGESAFVSAYRTEEQVPSWKARDPVTCFRDLLLIEAGTTAAALDAIDAEERGGYIAPPRLLSRIGQERENRGSRRSPLGPPPPPPPWSRRGPLCPRRGGLERFDPSHGPVDFESLVITVSSNV